MGRTSPIEAALGTAVGSAVNAEHLPNSRAPHHQMNAKEARLILYLRLRRARVATGDRVTLRVAGPQGGGPGTDAKLRRRGEACGVSDE